MRTYLSSRTKDKQTTGVSLDRHSVEYEQLIGIIQSSLSPTAEEIATVVCTKWIGTLDKFGKPTVYLNGHYYQPHRVLYQHVTGTVLKDTDWVYRTKTSCQKYGCMTTSHMHVSSENLFGNRTHHGPCKSIPVNGLVLYPPVKKENQGLPKRPPGG